jgi:hypothetical protein
MRLGGGRPPFVSVPSSLLPLDYGIVRNTESILEDKEIYLWVLLAFD